MKTIDVSCLSTEIREFLEQAQDERVMVTEDGEPLALVRGMRFKDAEDLAYEDDPEFWAEIERQRASSEPFISFEDVIAELGREAG